MDPGDLDAPAGPPPTPTRRPWWPRGLACLAIVPLLGFIGGQGRALWQEWGKLRRELVAARANRVIGYIGITPNPSSAARPDDWRHDEGGRTLLWAGYQAGEHRWFRVGLGDLGMRNLSNPIGRDAIRAIDRPIFEREGGPRWVRIPDEAPMMALEGGEEPPVYPVRVLEKVMAVNDRIGGRPILLAYTPVESNASAFRADLDGKVVVMGQSGYFVGRRPLLFDRRTESLWLEGEGAMTAVAGPLKGSSLPRIARLAPVAWGDWKGQHPRTRLLVGADRAGWGADGPTAMAP